MWHFVFEFNMDRFIPGEGMCKVFINPDQPNVFAIEHEGDTEGKLFLDPTMFQEDYVLADCHGCILFELYRRDLITFHLPANGHLPQLTRSLRC